MNGLKRTLVIIVTVPVLYILQTVVLPLIPYLVTVPNLLICAVMTFGFLYGKASGLFAGILCGLLMDLLGNGTPGFYTLIFALLGYGDGFLSEKIESEVIPILYVILAGNEIIFNAYVLLFSFLVGKHFAFGSYALHVFLPELLLTSIVFLILYGILIFLSKKWDLKVNKGEVKIV